MRKVLSLLLAMTLLSPAAVANARPSEIRGWTLLSNNDAGNERTIAAAREYRINHLQLPNADSVILTFIETGARVERQHSSV
jgi:hypothetical protein